MKAGGCGCGCGGGCAAGGATSASTRRGREVSAPGQVRRPRAEGGAAGRVRRLLGGR